MATTSSTNPLDLISSIPILQVLTTAERQQLTDRLDSRVFSKNELIYQIEHPADTLYILVKGTVKISTDSNEGREVIKQILHPVSLFGELGLAGKNRRQDTAIAMSKQVHLYAVRTKYFTELMRQNHQFSLRLLRWFGSRLQRTENRLESLIFKDARERIIDFLKDSARRRGKRIGYETLIRHSLTQQDIANLTGTSRQTVTSVLNELRKNNLIHFTRRSILIRDLSKL